jgi:hypothetical protein
MKKALKNISQHKVTGRRATAIVVNYKFFFLLLNCLLLFISQQKKNYQAQVSRYVKLNCLLDEGLK